MTPDQEKEMIERMRRIETRVTVMSTALGVPQNGHKPTFDTATGVVSLPSPHASLRSIINVIPKGWSGRVRMMVGDDVQGTLDIALMNR
jgi:hypothetical protein